MARPKKEKPNRADGLYEVKITIGKKLDGKLIRKSFYSSISKEDAKKQAEEYKIQAEVANRTGVGFVNKDASFSEWATTWLKKYKKPDVNINTYRFTYENTVNNHLIPYFGETKLTDIKPLDCKEFFATKTDLSESMLEKMLLCLNGIFNAAIENDLCYKNPAKNTTYSTTHTKAEKKVYSDDQIKVVEEFANNRMLEVILLLETGLRRGELLGLRAEDIDLEEQTISVNRSIADIKGGTKVMPPKWNSYRTNPLSRRAVEVLRSIGCKTGYIFPLGDSNTPQSPNTWSQKLKRFMVEMSTANPTVPELSAHELRHTYGTKLRRDGIDIFTIQKIMGHKDIKITTEVYVKNELETLKKAMANNLK